MHPACKWLVGGFGVAFGWLLPGCPFRLASFCPPRNLQVFSQPSTFDLRPSTLAAAQPPRVGAEGGILSPFIADWKAPLPQNLPPALGPRTARSVTPHHAPCACLSPSMPKVQGPTSSVCFSSRKTHHTSPAHSLPPSATNSFPDMEDWPTVAAPECQHDNRRIS